MTNTPNPTNSQSGSTSQLPTMIGPTNLQTSAQGPSSYRRMGENIAAIVASGIILGGLATAVLGIRSCSDDDVSKEDLKEDHKVFVAPSSHTADSALDSIVLTAKELRADDLEIELLSVKDGARTYRTVWKEDAFNSPDIVFYTLTPDGNGTARTPTGQEVKGSSLVKGVVETYDRYTHQLLDLAVAENIAAHYANWSNPIPEGTFVPPFVPIAPDTTLSTYFSDQSWNTWETRGRLAIDKRNGEYLVRIGDEAYVFAPGSSTGTLLSSIEETLNGAFLDNLPINGDGPVEKNFRENMAGQRDAAGTEYEKTVAAAKQELLQN